MSDSDDVPPLISPEQAQAIRDAIAGVAEAVARDARAAAGALRAHFANVLPPETPVLPQEEIK